MFGLSAEKLLLLAVLAVIILGPERLPGYAQSLGKWVRKIKLMVDNAQVQMKEELGEGYEDLDWKKLDPRQYDPRRIVREALADEFSTNPSAQTTAKPAASAAKTGLAKTAAVQKLASGEMPPFDSEAT